jgi:hypothetical protein
MLNSRSKSVPPIWMPRLAIERAGALRRDPHDREVGRAAAHVDDQRQLFARHLLLVVERRRDRLELEGDMLEALGAGGVFEFTFGLGIGLGIVVDELHGTTKHHAFNRIVRILFQPFPEVADEQTDDLGEGDRSGFDARLFMDQRTAEYALQRAHQATFDTVGIVGDGAAPKVGAVVLEIEEHRAGQRHLAVLQRHQLRLPVPDHADGGIRSAEVDTAECWSHRKVLYF